MRMLKSLFIDCFKAKILNYSLRPNDSANSLEEGEVLLQVKGVTNGLNNIG